MSADPPVPTTSLRLAVIMVNFRTPDLAIQSLESLDGELEPGLDRIIVVDNASGDGSAATISQAIAERGWDGWATLLESPDNRGFSAGNNYGIRRTDADFYLLLNSDTIVRPGALAELRETLEAHPKVGMVSPRLEWPNGEPQISCFRDFSPLSQLIDAAATRQVTRFLAVHDVPVPLSDEPSYPEWTSFAAVLIRKEALQEVGLLDEGYFMYFEDADYCKRMRLAGWKILNWPKAHIVHLRGGSSNVKASTEARRRRKRYYYAARARYLAKFGTRLGLLAGNLCWAAGRCISLGREFLGHRKTHICAHEARDIWTNWMRPLTGKHGMESK